MADYAAGCGVAMVRRLHLGALIAALIGALAAGCTGTEGDVLTSLHGDGSVSVPDGSALAIDAASGDARAQSADGGGMCAMDGPCPTPPLGQITLCGRVLDLADTSPLGGAAGQAGESVRVRVFDPIALTAGQSPLLEVQADSCGWYVATGAAGFLTLVVLLTDDDDEIGGDFQRVGSLISVSPGQVVRANAFALRTVTDNAWSASAGISGTFAGNGSVIPIYVDLNQPAQAPFQGAPVAGVVMTEAGGDPGNDDFYFTDTQPLVRSTIPSSATSTGANGTAILDDSSLPTPIGGTKSGCTFDDVNTITVNNMVLVQELNGTCN